MMTGSLKAFECFVIIPPLEIKCRCLYIISNYPSQYLFDMHGNVISFICYIKTKKTLKFSSVTWNSEVLEHFVKLT